MHNKPTNYVLRTTYSQSGQTIIETLAAIFILVTTLTVALGLATYTLSNSENSMREVVATNLARQGIEVIRMMRDSNWLGAEATTAPGFALTNCADISSPCYPMVFTGPVTGQPEVTNEYYLTTPNQATCNFTSVNCSRSVAFAKNFYYWRVQPLNMFSTLSTSVNYNLFLQQDGIYYSSLPSGCSSVTDCPPQFARKIKFTRINVPPYTNSNSNWELIVNSYVTWNGRRCPNILNQDPETLATSCKIVLEERLTNWKDYR